MNVRFCSRYEPPPPPTALDKRSPRSQYENVTPMTVTKGEKYTVTCRFELPGDPTDWRQMELQIYRTELGQTNLTKVRTLASSSAPAAAPAPPATAAAEASESPATTSTTDAPAPSAAEPAPTAAADGATSSSAGAATSATPDAGAATSATPDAGAATSATPDAGAATSATSDAGAATSSTPDAGAATSATPDAGAATSGTPDAAAASSTSTAEAGAKAANTPASPKNANSVGYVVPKPHCNLIAALIYFFHAGKQEVRVRARVLPCGACESSSVGDRGDPWTGTFWATGQRGSRVLRGSGIAPRRGWFHARLSCRSPSFCFSLLRTAPANRQPPPTANRRQLPSTATL